MHPATITLPQPVAVGTERAATLPTAWHGSLPSPVSSLSRYIQAVNRFPVLSEAEEYELARRFHETNDLDAARKLVLANLRYVVMIARQYFGYGLPEADLIQEGNVGLLKAVRRFDPYKGVRFITFAAYWIKAEIHDYILRNWRLVRIATTKAQKKLFFNLRKLLGGEPLTRAKADAIAETLAVKPEEVAEMHARFAGGDVALEGMPDSDEESDWRAPLAYLPDPSGTPEEAVAEAEAERLSQEGLEHALTKLDERSRAIVTRRWLTESPATLQELAAEYGISAERVRQIEAAALKKLRAWLTPQADAVL
ncbi:RNA polymerase sigma factor RpoH [Hydrogenophilus thiooxidans]|uniref:RNA polymerase sigma factor RpoH n=1 Tax=Hydrogenophilus thiooxidans TaxID=2820326 RepID=UPI001C22C566|nr:RNA polymerase sigma factor RpoH [Hydrogenophilus thiooxidans]